MNSLDIEYFKLIGYICRIERFEGSEVCVGKKVLACADFFFFLLSN